MSGQSSIADGGQVPAMSTSWLAAKTQIPPFLVSSDLSLSVPDATALQCFIGAQALCAAVEKATEHRQVLNLAASAGIPKNYQK